MEKDALIALVQKSKDGDMEAMEQLLLHAHTSVSYQCRKMLASQQDAEDMTQEILITVYEKLDTLQEPAAFYKWLHHITARRCMNAITRTHTEYQFAEDEEGNSILDTIEDMDEKKVPDKWLDNKETARMIEQIVTDLPEVQRMCVLMFYYSELSVKEMARIMKVSENTIKSRLNYARKAIKEKVLDYEKKEGIKLYGISPLPFLFFFLHRGKDESMDAVGAKIMVDRILAERTAAAAGMVTAAGYSTTGGAAVTAASTAGTASGGFLASVLSVIPVKVIAGITAAAILFGGIVAVNNINEDEAPEETVPVLVLEETAPSEAPEEETNPVPEETQAEETPVEESVPATEETAPRPTLPEEEPPREPTPPPGGNDGSSGGTDTPAETEPEETVHTHSYESSVTDPTCTEGGYTTYTCACGDSYTGDETEATGHSYQSTVFPPEHGAQGYTEHICENCGDTYQDNFVEPAGYSMLSGTDLNALIADDTTSVVFTYDPAPDDVGTTDLSAEQDGSIVAWYEGTDMYVSTADGGVITAAENCSGMFRDKTALTSVDLGNFDTSNITNMSNMFAGCSNLTSLDISGFDTSNVTRMYYMFDGCSSLTSLDLSNFDTGNVKTMGGMFYGCSSLTSLDLSNFDTSNVTDMSSMFNTCKNLTSLDLSSFDTGNVKSMRSMFTSCYNMTSLNVSSFDTANVSDMYYMFAACHHLIRLDLRNFNTGNVTNMNGMFSGCLYLQSLDVSSFDTGKVTDMSNMFSTCTSLTSLDVSSFDVSNVTTTSHMFYASSELETIFAGDWTAAAVNVVSDTYMFQNCSSLVGAVAYNGTDDLSMANPTTGYFTGVSTFALPSANKEEHTHTYTETVTAPTCTEVGYTAYVCDCGENYTADETEALGHSYESTVTEPTETEQGYTEHTCTVCGDIYRDSYTDPAVIPEEEPSPEEETHTHSYETTVVESTETEPGYTEYTCAGCGDTYRDSFTDPVTVPEEEPTTEEEPHIHGYEPAVTVPTCTEVGYTTYTCGCGDSYTAEETEAAGHSYGASVAEPTETEPGYTEYTCIVCGDTYRETA